MNSFRSANRQQQLQAYTNLHKRPTFRNQYPQHPQRRTSSVASSSVYDPDEARNIKISIKQAITLITLRLGRLEVFANENKIGEKVSESGVDKEFLLSIVTRLDNMEKLIHNLRIDSEKNRQDISTLNEATESIDIQEEPIILEMTKKIENINTFIENFQKDIWDLENENTEAKDSEEESETNEVLPPALVYNPNIIEEYVEPKVEVVEVESNVVEPTVTEANTEVKIEAKTEVNTDVKAPEIKVEKRRRGKKVTI